MEDHPENRKGTSDFNPEGICTYERTEDGSFHRTSPSGEFLAEGRKKTPCIFVEGMRRRGDGGASFLTDVRGDRPAGDGRVQLDVERWSLSHRGDPVASPRALTRRAECHQWFRGNERASSVFPTTCVHMCRASRVPSHGASGSSGQGFRTCSWSMWPPVPCVPTVHTRRTTFARRVALGVRTLWA